MKAVRYFNFILYSNYLSLSHYAFSTLFQYRYFYSVAFGHFTVAASWNNLTIYTPMLFHITTILCSVIFVSFVCTIYTLLLTLTTWNENNSLASTVIRSKPQFPQRCVGKIGFGISGITKPDGLMRPDSCWLIDWSGRIRSYKAAISKDFASPNINSWSIYIMYNLNVY